MNTFKTIKGTLDWSEGMNALRDYCSGRNCDDCALKAHGWQYPHWPDDKYSCVDLDRMNNNEMRRALVLIGLIDNYKDNAEEIQKIYEYLETFN